MVHVPAHVMVPVWLLAACGAPAQTCAPHWSTEFTAGPNDVVRAVHVRGSGAAREVFIGGSFTQVGPLQTKLIARWANGSWSALGTGLNPGGGGAFPGVYAITEYDRGSGPELYAGGHMYVSAALGEGIARWNGSEWHTVGGGVYTACVDCPPAVLDFAHHDDGSGPSLFIGGSFSHVGGGLSVPAWGVARWDGLTWDSLNGGLGFWDSTEALAVFDHGNGEKLYAHSWANGILRWDGRAWTQVAGAHQQGIWDLEAFDDGSGPALYTAEYLGSNVGRVRKWDGKIWTPVGPDFSSVVYALAGFNDGSGPSIHAGGYFNLPGGRGFARWDGAAWASVGGGVASPAGVAAMTAAPDDESLFVVGTFTTVGTGLTSPRIARWIGCDSCYPDCNGSASLTVADFSCFQSKFVAQDPYADCNADTAFTIADFACFQSKFVAGCP